MQIKLKAAVGSPSGRQPRTVNRMGSLNTGTEGSTPMAGISSVP